MLPLIFFQLEQTLSPNFSACVAREESNRDSKLRQCIIMFPERVSMAFISGSLIRYTNYIRKCLD